MVERLHLTPELVDSLEPPETGERWIADAGLRGFGVRLWAGKKGGGACFAIRVRSHDGRLIRESFSPRAEQAWRAQAALSRLSQRGERQLSLGLLHADAREWAIDRICEFKGRPTRAGRRRDRYRRASLAAQEMTLAQAAKRIFRKLEKTGKNPDYIFQLRKLFAKLSVRAQSTALSAGEIEVLASDIANPNLPVMQSRVLQAFIGQLYSRTGRWYAPAHGMARQLNRRIAAIRRTQSIPQPRILQISPGRLAEFLRLLGEEDRQWREALAVALYFETGAKLRRVLRARWDQIVGASWYPYSHAEREFWFMGREHLSPESKAILGTARDRLQLDGGTSDYVFPRNDPSGDRPITSVRRYWIRVARQFGWEGLSLRDVALRHRSRNTPSYTYVCYHMMVPIFREAADPAAVARFGKPEAR